MTQVKLLFLYYALATLFTGAVYGTVADADFGEVILRFGNDKVDRFLPDFLLRVSRG